MYAIITISLRHSKLLLGTDKVKVTCPNCGGDHPKWDCKRPAKNAEQLGSSQRYEPDQLKLVSRQPSATKSTDARAVEPKAAIAKRGSTGVSVNAVVAQEGGTTLGAGALALPVDTNREPFPSSDCKSDALPKEGLAAASSNLGAPTTIQKPKRGRPPTGFDKADYNRRFMRAKRARIKAEKEAGK